MKFNEVEKSLMEGKKVKLASWKNAYCTTTRKRTLL